MNILFVNLSALRFTAATPDHAPLGGSESALCYLARHLAQRGHRVSLTANLPDGTPESVEDVRHYPVATIKDRAFFIAQNFDAIILCNAPAAAAPLRAVSPKSKIIFWAHALPDQPSMQILTQPQTREAIDAAIFVSAWQQNEIERAFGPFRAAQVIGNGIAPAFENMFSSPQDVLAFKRNRAAYTTTPYRGLAALVRAMDGFDGGTTLDVFSSMRVYQGKDDDYAPIFAQAARNPAITCHGSVTQAELAARLRETAFLFYPCIYPETFCITAAEAMAAGLQIVTTDLGALRDTTMGFADLVPLTSSDGEALVQDFRAAMRRTVDAFAQNPAAWVEKIYAQIQKANATFKWSARAAAWEAALTGYTDVPNPR